MRFTKIEIDGAGGAFAIISRAGKWIEIIIVTRHFPDGRKYRLAVKASEPNIMDAATTLQRQLDGVEGTNSMVHDYKRVIEFFTES